MNCSSSCEQKSRLVFLDVFRGATVAAMLLVNNPGSWAHVYPPLRHAAWHGLTPTDLIFPFFLFAVGVAMALSFGRRVEAGAARWGLLRKVASRSFIIFGLGLLLNLFPFPGWGAVRWWGVLQRIAVCYLIAGTTVVVLSRHWSRVAAMIGLCLCYEFLMRWPLVPGWGAGSFALTDNFARWVDLAWLGAAHLYQGSGVPFDPEGMVSSLPAAAGVLAGYFCGQYLRGAFALGRALVRLLVVGVVLVGLGWAGGYLEPVNKQLWTVSYMVLTSGLALLVLAVCGWLVETRGWTRCLGLLIVFGSNALLAFVGTGLAARIMAVVKVTAADGVAVSAKTLLYRAVYRPFLGPENASLAYAIGTVLVWWILLRALYRHRVFIKV